jgi:G3E family GTPase
MATVVDAPRLIGQINAGESLQRRGLSAFDGDDRTVADLLVDQIEFADVIVVNKTDLVTPGELVRVEALVTRLNPGARQIRAVFGRVPPADLLHTGSFDMAATETARAGSPNSTVNTFRRPSPASRWPCPVSGRRSR